LGHFEDSVEEWLESYRVAEELGGGAEMGLAATCLGLGYLSLDIHRALEWSQAGIARNRTEASPWALGFALTVDGILHSVAGDAAAASAQYHEALSIQRSLDDKEGSGLSLSGLAILASMSGDLPEAIDLYQRSLAAFESIGDRAEEARVLSEMAWTHLSANDPVAARSSYLESVEAYNDVGSVRGIGTSLIGLAAIAAVEGRAREAVTIAAAAEVFTVEEGVVNVYSEGVPGHDIIERAKAEVAPDELDRALEEGRTLSVSEALELARAGRQVVGE
jgi:tetratricopeptide (TPR) repeat protein